MAKDKPQSVTYQIGVDILGFPIFIEHTIICETQVNFIKPKKTLNVLQRIFKQH
ncbi:hypothetical protein [Flavobacterium gilvum]|uniref:hypothetical protein n=1 Tax=Flavobacterium gilvum TaxID=1492737 RepID=UPI0004E316FA|nr:hypothetical protein [Flavobacterium gilvum]KFC60015.1 hypothetical protein FEM08_11940 [Flavobacterium gilvum]